MRRVGVVMGTAENDPEAQIRLAAHRLSVQELGWKVGHNLELVHRYTQGDQNLIRTLANEIVTLRPEVIVANTAGVTAAIQRETKAIPIVFVVVPDPLGSGTVMSL